MKPRVYVETSVLSYLTGLPSRDLVVAAHQQLTHTWWTQRARFALCVSEAVLAEARQGDPSAASRRLAVADGLEVVGATPAAELLTTALLRAAALPAKAAIDAAHVALATVHGLEFLVTWNCTHIANAAMRPRIDDVCRRSGFKPPIICTREELLQPEDP